MCVCVFVFDVRLRVIWRNLFNVAGELGLLELSSLTRFADCESFSFDEIIFKFCIAFDSELNTE